MVVTKRSGAEAWLLLFLLLVQGGGCIKWLGKGAVHSRFRDSTDRLYSTGLVQEGGRPGSAHVLHKTQDGEKLAKRVRQLRMNSFTCPCFGMREFNEPCSRSVSPESVLKRLTREVNSFPSSFIDENALLLSRYTSSSYDTIYRVLLNCRALGRTGDGYTWTREACTSAKSSGLLERKQARACRATPDVMPSLVQAARDTSTVCQQAFRHRRWNCSSIERAPDYTPELLTGTREQAFVYAMSAAAAVWRLARGCALGSLAACSCATPPRREPPSPSALISPSSFTATPVSFGTISARNSFKWGGCGDDVRSASRMAKRFLQGATPPGTGATAKFMHAVNMHNNRAGRRAVEQSLTLECKCHGVSGSCSVRTCWRGLGSSGPSAAGSRLLRRYATAAEVRPRSGGRLPPLYHHDNLLYTTKSPDYCLPDKKRGSLGTIGRQCNGSSFGYEGCEYLCCGRGHVTKTEEVLERCDCKYISCCYVKCKTCREVVKTYECI